ncbi:hypothetical protein BOTCAL_0252g00090 [Botryotinia calthae]|uniref:Uncharacterized protein n=1 Tax=Botryotinia calthae TaxID=38488 RepID=A0A4Y8CZ64_9HELO|nr:hypothetical protein BOTCAL_0252g00090 [Botryotinia calthae]
MAELNGGVGAFRCATKSRRKMYALNNGVKRFSGPINHFLKPSMKPSVKEEYSYSFWMTWGLGHGYDPDLGLITYLEDCSPDSLFLEPWNYGVRLSHGEFGAAAPYCSSKAKKKVGAYLKTLVDGVLAFRDPSIKKDA